MFIALQDFFVFFAELEIRFMNWKVEQICGIDEFFL